MSAAKKNETKTWELTGPWAGAWKIFAGIGALGLAGAAGGYATDPKRFAFSWLFAFMTCLAVALGAIFFVLVQRLTSAGWSVTVRRTAEFFGYGIIALIPAFFVVVATMNTLFPWLQDHGHGGHDGAEKHSQISLITPAYAQEHAPAATPSIPGSTGEGAAAGHGEHAEPAAAHGHGQGGGRGTGHGTGHDAAGHDAAGHDSAAHGTPAAHGHGSKGDPHAIIHGKIMQGKSAYLNRNFFLLRAVLYFLIWTILAVRLLGMSTAQDVSKDPELTLKAQRFSPPAMFLFALSLTFAAFDWLMSLEPSWFSTIFGVYFFACGVVSSYAVLILVTLALRKAGPLDGAVTIEHYHDLGKLMFGFLVFWAYVAFSQFMLIWYASLPEETTWYHNRWDFAPWSSVSLFVIAGHFVIPFFWLLSRNFKRDLGRLQIGAAIILVMHVVDMYWFVMPNFGIGKPGFAFSWIDGACLLAMIGIYGAFVFFRMTKHSLVPVGDPRLQRSLHFQNA